MLRSRPRFTSIVAVGLWLLVLFGYIRFMDPVELRDMRESWEGLGKALGENGMRVQMGGGTDSRAKPFEGEDGKPMKGTSTIKSPLKTVPTIAKSPGQSSTPSPSPLPDRIVVLGRLSSENTSWISTELPTWRSAIYTVDAPNSTTLHTPFNKGHEANPYLKYIIDNYSTLPSTMAFIHAHQKGYPRAWHNDNPEYDNAISLRSLNIEYVQKNGYVNLRCNWNPGCPDEVQPFRDPPDGGRTIEHAMPKAWQRLFLNSDVPKVLATPCCAQFAVSKKQVLKRPRSDYVRFYKWLEETELDDALSGRVFEYLWHVIFGQEAVYCPDYATCQCQVYGECFSRSLG